MDKSEVFKERWLRLLDATDSKSDTALARVLNILPQSVNAARKREQIPTGWIEKISLKFGVSTDWLFFGREPSHVSNGYIEPGESSGAEMPDASAITFGKIISELEMERKERREMSEENRVLHKENAALLRENGELKAKLARLEAHESGSADEAP